MLEVVDRLKLLTVYFALLVHAAGVVCPQSGLLGTDPNEVDCGGFIQTLN